MIIALLIGHNRSSSGAFYQLLAAFAPLALLTMALYALLIAAIVRLASRPIRPGIHPAHGKVGGASGWSTP